MSWSAGEITAALGALSTLVLGVWALVGKGRGSLQVREDRWRSDQQARIKELETERDAESTRADTAENALAMARRNLDKLKDFLQDVIGDSYALEWIKKRAAELLRRIAP